MIDFEMCESIRETGRVLKPCLNCKNTKPTIWRIISPKPYRYFVECDTCHWCGRTRWFKWSAKNAWNRRDSNGRIKTGR